MWIEIKHVKSMYNSNMRVLIIHCSLECEVRNTKRVGLNFSLVKLQ